MELQTNYKPAHIQIAEGSTKKHKTFECKSRGIRAVAVVASVERHMRVVTERREEASLTAVRVESSAEIPLVEN